MKAVPYHLVVSAGAVVFAAIVLFGPNMRTSDDGVSIEAASAANIAPAAGLSKADETAAAQAHLAALSDDEKKPEPERRGVFAIVASVLNLGTGSAD